MNSLGSVITEYVEDYVGRKMKIIEDFINNDLPDMIKKEVESQLSKEHGLAKKKSCLDCKKCVFEQDGFSDKLGNVYSTIHCTEKQTSNHNLSETIYLYGVKGSFSDVLERANVCRDYEGIKC